uniref:RIB43A domain with coiled-coils 2 n=1 Tax=Myripristis murdjan TaxID=586833 RepID=A0A668AEI0_9TELE
MQRVELLSERAAATNLETRRSREMQRQQRIFDNNMRTIGVDKEALDNQVREKQKQAEAEKEFLDAHAADMLCDSKAACLLDSRQVKQARAVEKAISQYRRSFQQPSSRREFDLNDPERLRNTDAEGAQMMLPGLVGEDPDSKTRVQRQREQLRLWSLQQQRERAAARQQQRMDDQQYDQSRVSLDNKALQLEKIEQERRKAATLATTDYNLAMWAQMEDRQRQQKKHDDENNRADILNHLQEEQVGDEVRPILGVLGVPRLRPSTDRRAPPESLQQIQQFQQYQIEEKKHEHEERQECLRVASARAALLLERQQTRLNKQLRRELDGTNTKLADAQRQHFDDSFFSKFNTSSR